MLTYRALKALVSTMPEAELDRTVSGELDGETFRVESVTDGKLRALPAEEPRNGRSAREARPANASHAHR